MDGNVCAILSYSSNSHMKYTYTDEDMVLLVHAYVHTQKECSPNHSNVKIARTTTYLSVYIYHLFSHVTCKKAYFFFFCLLQQQDKPTCPSFSFCLSVSLRGEMVKPTFFTFWLFSLVGPNPTSCPLGFVESSFAWSCG